MKKYIKQIEGEDVIKERYEIIIKSEEILFDEISGEQNKIIITTINPNEETLLSNGWSEYIAPIHESTESDLLDQAKERKLMHLKEYDESENVNDCIIIYKGQEIHYWASKSERDALKGTVRDCINFERNTYRLDLREKKINLELNCGLLLRMLGALEIYAVDCYNKTTDHEYAIKSLTTIEEVESYDYHIGYPEKLTFTIE